MRTRDYEARFKRPDWDQKRALVMARSGLACEGCGVYGRHDVHHKHYDSFGDESLDDLQHLCRPCHEKADAARREQSASDAWGRRLDGWATKRYGEDWEHYPGWETAEEAFERWLETREDEY